MEKYVVVQKILIFLGMQKEMINMDPRGCSKNINLLGYAKRNDKYGSATSITFQTNIILKSYKVSSDMFLYFLTK